MVLSTPSLHVKTCVSTPIRRLSSVMSANQMRHSTNMPKIMFNRCLSLWKGSNLLYSPTKPDPVACSLFTNQNYLWNISHANLHQGRLLTNSPNISSTLRNHSIVHSKYFSVNSKYLNCETGKSRKEQSANQLSEKVADDGPPSKRDELKENIFTIPNYLTVGRFIVSPILGYMVLTEQFGVVCTLFILSSITDVLDGYIARNWKGEWLD